MFVILTIWFDHKLFSLICVLSTIKRVPVHAWTLFISRKFLEKIDKNCNCLCVTEKKKKQTMHVYYCTITKSKSNHGSFKPQISGIHVCIIISEAYIKKTPVVLLCLVHTKVYYLFVKESTLVNHLRKGEVCETLFQVPFFIIRWGLKLCDIAEKNNHWKFVTEENQIHDLRILTIL